MKVSGNARNVVRDVRDVCRVVRDVCSINLDTVVHVLDGAALHNAVAKVTHLQVVTQRVIQVRVRHILVKVRPVDYVHEEYRRSCGCWSCPA